MNEILLEYFSIKREIKKRGLTLQKVAEKLHTNACTLSSVLSGRRSNSRRWLYLEFIKREILSLPQLETNIYLFEDIKRKARRRGIKIQDVALACGMSLYKFKRSLSGQQGTGNSIAVHTLALQQLNAMVNGYDGKN